VGTVGALVAKVVEKGYDVPPTRVGGVGRDETLEEAYLIKGGVGVARRRLDHLESDMSVHAASDAQAE